MWKDLEKNEQYLRDFFNHAPVGFHVFGADRLIADINQAELDMIGYQRDEVVGKKKWSDLILPEQKKVFERHWKTLSKGEKVSHYNYTLKHKSGLLVYVVLYATARFNEKGKIINTRGIVVDVREGKLNNIHTISGDHPLPSEKNVSATEEMIELLSKTTDKDLVIFVISGGGSTLLCQPEEMTCLDEGEILQSLSAAGEISDSPCLPCVVRHP